MFFVCVSRHSPSRSLSLSRVSLAERGPARGDLQPVRTKKKEEEKEHGSTIHARSSSARAAAAPAAAAAARALRGRPSSSAAASIAEAQER